MPVASVIQHAKRIFSAPYHIVTRGLSDCIIFFHIISQTAGFSGEKNVSQHKMRVSICSTPKHFSF
jgi:hypothetical protein